MALRKVALLLVLALLLTSCGGGGNSNTTSPPPTPSPTPTAANITGNWDITAQSAVSPGPVEVGGSLVSNGTQISGVVHILNSSCFQLAQDVSISGTITASSNAVSLTSAPVAGQVVTVAATASADGRTLSNGTYSIAGGCAAGDHGSIIGFIVPPFTNTYSGTFVSANSGGGIGVTVTTAQSSSPDSDGLFHVTGTVAFANSACFASATIKSSQIAGGFLFVDMTPNSGGDIVFSGNITDSTGKTISGTYQVNSGNCAGDTGTGTISSGPVTPQNITVAVSPVFVTLAPSGTQQYTATVTGTTNTAVTWSAGGVKGGNSTFGTINASGLYTAPAAPPNPSSVTITAFSVADPTKSGTATADIHVHHDNQDPQNGPIKLGTSGGNSTDTTRSANTLFCCSGTLGALVSRAGTFYILSNNHVLNKSDQGAVGDPISQPGLADSNCGNAGIRTVANMTQAAPLKTSNIDGAIAQIVSGQVDASGTILDLAATGQAAQPSATTGVATVNQGVAKSGDATGLTCSTVIATNAAVRVTYSTSCQGGTNFDVVFQNQVAITGANFSNSGDSGSVIVDSATARPIALLYAGSSTGTVGNPIQDVYNALKDSNGVAPQVVGGPDHPVSCPAGSQSQIGTVQNATATRGLSEEQVARATLAKNHREIELMQDSSVVRVEVGHSDDNLNESAVVLFFDHRPMLPIPAQIDGVRTRVIFSPEVGSPSAAQRELAAAAIADSELIRARTAKEQHAEELMKNAAIVGVGVGASNDSPGEAALVVFVEQGKSVVVPALIEGVRTRVVATDPFRTFNWGKRTVTACSRK